MNVNNIAWSDPADPVAGPVEGETVLVCSPNWLGDAVMSMPAIQAFRIRFPGRRIVVLAVKNLVPLWRMHPAIEECIPLERTIGSALHAVRTLRKRPCSRAFILPHAARAAAVAFLARIPVRAGLKGYRRGMLLTHALSLDPEIARAHHTFEYLHVMGLDDVTEPGLPRLEIPEAGRREARRLLSECGTGPKETDTASRDQKPLIALMPGAARGVAKQWPADYFTEVGRRLSKENGCGILVLGSAGEQALCSRVAGWIGKDALNLAGRTTLPGLAALLDQCRALVGNDSGGMHLAAALGIRVAAVFGTTDPARTGPSGSGHRLILAEGVARSRRVGRDAEEAMETLRQVKPDRVYDAVLDIAGLR